MVIPEGCFFPPENLFTKGDANNYNPAPVG